MHFINCSCKRILTWHKRMIPNTVWLAAALLLLQVAGPCLSLRDEHVIALESATTGIVVSVLSRNGLDYSISDPHFLSPACGNNFLRCQDLKVVSYALTNTTSQHITLVPVLGGICMFEFHYNGFELSFHKNHVAELGCNPMGIYKLERAETYYVLCLNRTVLNGHIVTLNRENSSIKLSQTPHLNIFVEKPSHLSNFVYVTFGNNASEGWIYFAKGASLYRISPFLTPSYSVVGNLTFGSYKCHTETIVYARDGILIAFCHDINNVSAVLYFDLNNRWVNNATIFAIRQPYVCPNPDVRLTVNKRDSSIQYGLWSQSSDKPNTNNLAEFTIPSENFDSGVCLTGPENNSLLVYSDRQKGVFLFDTGTFNFKRLSSVGCPNSFCEPLLVYDSRYVAIRERQGNATVKIIDAAENYTAIINGRVSADLLTMIYDLNPITEPTLPTEITVQTRISQYWLFVFLPAGLIGVLGISAAISYYRKRRRRVRNPHQDGVQDEPERCLIPGVPTNEGPTSVAVVQDTHPSSSSFVSGHSLPLPHTSNRVLSHTFNVEIQDERNRQDNNLDNNNIPPRDED